jgi:hypothetical protein
MSANRSTLSSKTSDGYIMATSYVRRPDGTCSPIIAADELPEGLSLFGAPRKLDPLAAVNMRCIAEEPHPGNTYCFGEADGRLPRKAGQQIAMSSEKRSFTSMPQAPRAMILGKGNQSRGSIAKPAFQGRQVGPVHPHSSDAPPGPNHFHQLARPRTTYQSSLTQVEEPLHKPTENPITDEPCTRQAHSGSSKQGDSSDSESSSSRIPVSSQSHSRSCPR